MLTQADFENRICSHEKTLKLRIKLTIYVNVNRIARNGYSV